MIGKVNMHLSLALDATEIVVYQEDVFSLKTGVESCDEAIADEAGTRSRSEESGGISLDGCVIFSSCPVDRQHLSVRQEWFCPVRVNGIVP